MQIGTSEPAARFGACPLQSRPFVLRSSVHSGALGRTTSPRNATWHHKRDCSPKTYEAFRFMWPEWGPGAHQIDQSKQCRDQWTPNGTCIGEEHGLSVWTADHSSLSRSSECNNPFHAATRCSVCVDGRAYQVCLKKEALRRTMPVSVVPRPHKRWARLLSFPVVLNDVASDVGVRYRLPPGPHPLSPIP